MLPLSAFFFNFCVTFAIYMAVLASFKHVLLENLGWRINVQLLTSIYSALYDFYYLAFRISILKYTGIRPDLCAKHIKQGRSIT